MVRDRSAFYLGTRLLTDSITNQMPSGSAMNMKLANIDVPKEVSLTLPEQALVAAGSASYVLVAIMAPFVRFIIDWSG